MKKYIIGFVLLVASLCLAEQITATTTAVKVVPSFGKATFCSVENTGEVYIYAYPNITTLATSNAIAIKPGGAYTFNTKKIYHVWVQTTNSTAGADIAFE